MLCNSEWQCLLLFLLERATACIFTPQYIMLLLQAVRLDNVLNSLNLTVGTITRVIGDGCCYYIFHGRGASLILQSV